MCLKVVISLNIQTEVWQVFVKLMPPCFLPLAWGKNVSLDRNTHKLHKNTRTTIVIHSTVRFSVSYPVSAVGSCPNKGALHFFIVLLSSDSHKNIFFFPSQTLQSWKERMGAATFSDPIRMSDRKPTKCFFTG